MGIKKGLNKIMKNRLIKQGRKIQETDYSKFYETTPQQTTSSPSDSDIDIIFNQINSSGLDIKGQHNSAVAKHLKGISMNVSVDVGDLILPGALTLEGKVGGEFKRGKSLLINLETQIYPLSVQNNVYICLSIMQGICRDWNVKCNVTAELGTTEKIKKINDIITLEKAGYSIDASVGLTVNASYDGEYIYVFDPIYPRWISRSEDVSKKIKSILDCYVFNEAIWKANIKKSACLFLNSLGEKEISYKKKGIKAMPPRLIGKGHISTQKLIDKLEEIQSLDISDVDKKQAEYFIELLKRWGGKYKSRKELPAILPNKYCSLRLWGHKGDAGAQAYAGLMLKKKSKQQKNSSKVKNKTGLGVEASASTRIDIKRSSFRYQMLQQGNIVKTQDVVITYKQVGAQLTCSVDGTIFTKGQKNIKKDSNIYKKKEIEKTKEIGKEWVFINQMSYRCATLYWNYSYLDTNKKEIIKKLKAQGAVKVLPTPKILGNEVISVLPGSGLSFGQSIALGSLEKLSNFSNTKLAILKNKDKQMYNYIISLMKTLGMSICEKDYNMFMSFVNEIGILIKDLIENFMIELAIVEGYTRKNLLNDKRLFSTFKEKAKRTGVLLEAIYTTISNNVRINRKGTNPEPEDLIKNLKKGNLQSLRLRYRTREVSKESKTLFSLGFSVGIVNVGIALKDAKYVGSEGIIDINNKFFTKLSPNHPKIVPPAVLFYQ